MCERGQPLYLKKSQTNRRHKMKVEHEEYMPCFVVGMVCQYGGENEPTFHKEYRRFDGLYWTNRTEAEAWLAKCKSEKEAEVEEARKTLDRIDPELVCRINNGRCTKEDTKKPGYDEAVPMVHRLQDWEHFWSRLTIGRGTTPAKVYRLNTLLNELEGENPQAAQKKMAEIEEKVKYFGHCTIAWSCMGQTRAKWQTKADAAWLRKNKPEWKVTVNEYGDEVMVEEAA